MPLSHAPGHAQCDFGEALVVIGGVERKAHYFGLDLLHSDGCFIKAYPAETTEAFLDGHVSTFGFLGGVPQSILYDNTKLAVARILGDGRRKRTRAFTELESHYLFDDRFGRPGNHNDKGKVEGMVGYMRRNFLVPMPSLESFTALNAHLEQPCLERMDAQLRGHAETIGQRMEGDLEALLPSTAVPYYACEKQAGRLSSLSLVRYRTNDYSVPVAYGHRDVLVRGYVDQVVISCGLEVIARHRRSYQRDGFIYDPIHYLPLLEQKTGALDQAAPLQEWDLPEEFGTLRLLSLPKGAGIPNGTQGQAGVRPGAPAAGKLLSGGSALSGERCYPPGYSQLRRGEAFGAVPTGGSVPQAGPGAVPLPAPGQGEHYIRRGLHDPPFMECCMTDKPTLLLKHHLKELKLPSFLRKYGKMAAQYAAEGADHPQYLLRLAELELIDRHQRMVRRRIRAARFPAVKILDTFDFTAIPSVNKPLVLVLARCEYIQRRQGDVSQGLTVELDVSETGGDVVPSFQEGRFSVELKAGYASAKYDLWTDGDI